MQYSTVFLALLSGALAIPTYQPPTDNTVIVTLAGADELATAQDFQTVQFGLREEKDVNFGPFQTVDLSVGKGVSKQDLRCQVLNEEGEPIVVLRGKNRDITFSDADGGKWTFERDSVVSTIICDPTFVKANGTIPIDTSIKVLLSGTNQPQIKTSFLLAGTEGEIQLPAASYYPFDTVELRVGAGVENQDLRCRIHDAAGKPITVKRNTNIDTTFSDKKKGAWAFYEPLESEVLAIVCDGLFKAAPAPTPIVN